MDVKKKKSYAMDMCNGPLLGKILIFTIPLMLSSLLQLFFNAADMVVVGRFAGDDAVGAVGCNTALINLLTNMFIGFSIGGNVLAARYFGAKKEEELSKTVHTAMLLSIICGILVTVIGISFADIILTWMGTPEKIHGLAVVYLRIYFLGMTAMMIYNFGSSILRAIGDTRRPLIFLLTAGVINVVLNLIFVIAFDMSVAGVALATAISQCISAILIVRCLIKETGAIKLIIKKLKLDKDKVLKIVQIGLPASIQGILFSLSNVIIQSSINSFGDIVVSGNSAAASLEGFVYVSMNAFSQASMSFTSQNLGSAKYERIGKILLISELCVMTVGIVFGNVMYLFGKPLLSIYTDSPAVVEAGLIRMLYVCCPYFLCGMMDVAVGALRGLGYSFMPMIVSLIGACGLRLLWIFTAFRLDEFHTPQWLFMTYPVSWLLTVTTHIICFMIIKKRINRRAKESALV